MRTLRRIGRYRLRLKGGGWREGVLVQFDNGGWGEAAPLPGWSAESVDDALAWLRRPAADPPPSVRAALEMDQPGPPLRRRVPVNALLDGSPAEMLARGRDALGAGCRCLKIKAARLDQADLARLMGALAEREPGIRFRIDPNRSWSAGQTLQAAAALSGFPVEYFEEPAAGGPETLRQLAAAGVPVALDETLREITPEMLETFGPVKALVLKPTLMGGFEQCREFALEGSRLGIPSVVSACYESGAGTAALGRFAAALPLISDAGLDTYSRLEEDVLRKRIEFDGYAFEAAAAPPEVDDGRLVF